MNTLLISHVSGVEVIVVVVVSYPTAVFQTLIRPAAHLIKDVEISLSWVLADHSGLLQQKIRNLPPRGLAGVEKDLNVFAKSGGVVISHCLGVPECLEERIGELDHVLDMVCSVPAARDLGYVVHDKLGCHCLASSALAGDDDALVLLVGGETPVHVVCQRVHVRRVLVGGLQETLSYKDLCF